MVLQVKSYAELIIICWIFHEKLMENYVKDAENVIIFSTSRRKQILKFYQFSLTQDRNIIYCDSLLQLLVERAALSEIYNVFNCNNKSMIYLSS